MLESNRVRSHRLISVVSLFVILYMLAGVSRAGFCQDSECYLPVFHLGAHDFSTAPASERQPCGEGCYCCNTSILPGYAFEIEPLRVQALTIVSPEIHPLLVGIPSVYHPPKSA